MLIILNKHLLSTFEISVLKKKPSIQNKDVGSFLHIKKTGCRITVGFCAGLEKKSGVSHQAVIHMYNLGKILVLLLNKCINSYEHFLFGVIWYNLAPLCLKILGAVCNFFRA